MKISYNWLKKYVVDLPEAEKVSEVFTFHICEVESVDKLENGDYVFDIKVLPDRAHDLLSHRGVAKDLAGILGLSFNDFKYEAKKGEQTKLEVKVESENCRRYMGRIVRGVKVGPSPEWIKNYLESLGQRSINNIVDATNIVMFDLGQPIHAFDLAKLANEKIIVRNAKDGEAMTTLDNKEVKFTSQNMVIADGTTGSPQVNEVLAIAGVKGGKKAEVDNSTKDIVIEVANFDPISVRKTGKTVNIFTDAVKRFENDLSPEVAEIAMNEITALILEMCPDVKVEEFVDVYPKKSENKIIKFSLSKVSKILGIAVSTEEAEKILKQFNYRYQVNGDVFEMEVPFDRPDLVIEEDMAEEIGRAIGYDKIPAQIPELGLKSEMDDIFKKIEIVREKFITDGYGEVINYTFCSDGEVEVLASASDKRFLRTNLAEGMKESLKLNKLNMPFLGMKDIKIFEIGTVFFKDKEEIHVAYNEKKNIVEKKLEDFVLGASDIFSSGPRFSLPQKSPSEIEARPDHSEKASDSPKRFIPWSIYPFISRDVAVWMPEGESHEKLKNILIENGTSLLVKEPYLFDSFAKDGKTSYAFRLVFQSYERTLTDDEINKIMNKINQKIIENSDWQVR